MPDTDNEQDMTLGESIVIADKFFEVPETVDLSTRPQTSPVDPENDD